MNRLGVAIVGVVLAVASGTAAAQQRGDWSRDRSYGDAQTEARDTQRAEDEKQPAQPDGDRGGRRDGGDRGGQRDGGQRDGGQRDGGNTAWRSGNETNGGDRYANRSGGGQDWRGGDRDGNRNGSNGGNYRDGNGWNGGNGRDGNRGGDWNGNRDGRGGDRYGYNGSRHDDRRHGNDRHDRDHRGGWNGNRGHHDGRYAYYSRHHRYGYNRWRAPSRYYRPRGWYSYNWGIGHRLPPAWYGPSYYVDYGVYGLAPPPYGYRWVRVDDDVLLVAIATGIIADILTDFYYY